MAKLRLKIQLAGDVVAQAAHWRLGDHVTVHGFLAQASHRHPEQLVLHVQSLEQQD